MSYIFDTVFIDLDGPILDGKLRHYHCYADIIQKYNGVPLEIELYWSKKRAMITRDVLLAQSKFQENYDVFFNEWFSNIETLHYLNYDKIKPKVYETLEFWESQCKEIVLITMRHNRENLLVQLKNIGIIDLFDEILDCNPQIFLPKYTRLKNRKIKNSIFIGDTEEDVNTARKLGIPVVGVLNGLREKQYLHADFFVDEITQINFNEISLSIL